MSNDQEIKFTCRVSSTINRDVKNFGKQFMFDDNDETCWNSDKGLPQQIRILYEEPVTFSRIEVQFQGGFAIEECDLEMTNSDSSLNTETVQFENINAIQIIKLEKTYTCNQLKITITKSFDTYGRIVIYHLRLKS